MTQIPETAVLVLPIGYFDQIPPCDLCSETGCRVWDPADGREVYLLVCWCGVLNRELPVHDPSLEKALESYHQDLKHFDHCPECSLKLAKDDILAQGEHLRQAHPTLAAQGHAESERRAGWEQDG